MVSADGSITDVEQSVTCSRWREDLKYGRADQSSYPESLELGERVDGCPVVGMRRTRTSCPGGRRRVSWSSPAMTSSLPSRLPGLGPRRAEGRERSRRAAA